MSGVSAAGLRSSLCRRGPRPPVRWRGGAQTGASQLAGKLKGDEITFTAGGTEYTGKVNGTTIEGTTKSGEKW